MPLSVLYEMLLKQWTRPEPCSEPLFRTLLLMVESKKWCKKKKGAKNPPSHFFEIDKKSKEGGHDSWLRCNLK
jgi:hypothetical protein